MDGTPLREKVDALPERPGVYLYRNAQGALLYVGKAKSLRQRVRSYFQAGAQHAPRTVSLVAEIADLETIVVDTEMEALMLEANFIKKERPPYNVILRDDKSFPYLKLSLADEYPRVSLVRRARLDKNAYYGPFLPASVARRSLKLIPRFFQVATCDEVFDGKRRPCLYYHLDQCLAPCAGKATPEEYGRAVADAKLFLEGRHKEASAALTPLLEVGSPQLAIAERLAGYAVMQSRAGFAKAKPHFEASLAAAQAANAQYEVALTLRAVAETSGADDGGAAETLHRLGIVSTPSVPLP